METIDKLFALFVLAAIVFVGILYFNQLTMNEVKSEVFGNITNTTTNKEIVEYIHIACNNTPWYVWRADCENELLKTFITPTKLGV